MHARHTVALLAYNGFQVLDVTGPAGVFASANRAIGRPFYDIQIVSPEGGPVIGAGGVTLLSTSLRALSAAKVGTLLIAGSEEYSLRAVIDTPAVRRWVGRCAESALRFGSVCTGAFVLAAFGLLEGKRVATHWAACNALATSFPGVVVDSDAMFVVDARTWTSAGVTTGIDMALAMVDQDVGIEIANVVARHLVLYVRRPGFQSQFSPFLQAQVSAGASFADLVEWVRANLEKTLNVAALADRSAMSERSFYRKFVRAMGQTPAQFIESVRLDAARMLLVQGVELKIAAKKVGLSPTARFARAFKRKFGLTPKLYGEIHACTVPPPMLASSKKHNAAAGK